MQGKNEQKLLIFTKPFPQKVILQVRGVVVGGGELHDAETGKVQVVDGEHRVDVHEDIGEEPGYG